MLAVSLSVSGCGVHLDDGSGDTVIANKVQMARYRASACQEAIQAGIDVIGYTGSGIKQDTGEATAVFSSFQDIQHFLETAIL